MAKPNKELARYRSLTGKKRLSKEEKQAVLNYSADQVYNASKLSRNAYNKRVRAYKLLTDKPLTESDYADLKYLTPRQLANKKKLQNSEAKPTKHTDAEGINNTESTNRAAVFSPVVFPSNIRWWDIPSTLRNSKSERRPGGSLYENQEYFWANPESVQLTRFFYNGINGKQFSVNMAMRIILQANGVTDILIDPEDTGERFAVYREEWDNAESLDAKYTTNRRYTRKT